MSKWPVEEVKHSIYDVTGEKWFYLIKHIMDFASRFDDSEYVLRDIVIALLENMLGGEVKQIAILTHNGTGEKVIKWIIE